MKLMALTLVLMVLSAFAVADTPSQREKRPLYVNDVKELGIRILTEAQPKWSVQLEMNRDDQYMVRAATPSRTYPPGEMVWLVMSELRPTAQDLREVAYKAILGHVDRYAAVSARPRMTDLKLTTYGDISGFEYSFSGLADNVATDVRMFVGNKSEKALVLMQATTRRGKMAHLSEQIRRSWTNIRYLDEVRQENPRR